MVCGNQKNRRVLDSCPAVSAGSYTMFLDSLTPLSDSFSTGPGEPGGIARYIHIFFGGL